MICCSFDAERQGSGAANSGSGADAVCRRLHPLVGHGRAPSHARRPDPFPSAPHRRPHRTTAVPWASCGVPSAARSASRHSPCAPSATCDPVRPTATDLRAEDGDASCHGTASGQRGLSRVPRAVTVPGPCSSGATRVCCHAGEATLAPGSRAGPSAHARGRASWPQRCHLPPPCDRLPAGLRGATSAMTHGRGPATGARHPWRGMDTPAPRAGGRHEAACWLGAPPPGHGVGETTTPPRCAHASGVGHPQVPGGQAARVRSTMCRAGITLLPKRGWHPRGVPLSLFCTCGAQRWRSPAAESGRDAGADAGGSQVQRFVRGRRPPAHP